MAKSGRKPKICIHGLKKWDCKICVDDWKNDYYGNYLSKGKLKSGESHRKYIKTVQFPLKELNYPTRKKFIYKGGEYYETLNQGYSLTRYIYNNYVKEERRGTLADFCYSEVPS